MLENLYSPQINFDSLPSWPKDLSHKSSGIFHGSIKYLLRATAVGDGAGITASVVDDEVGAAAGAKADVGSRLEDDGADDGASPLSD